MIWNDQAGVELCEMMASAKRGRSGSAVLGVFATDSILESPGGGAGVYLVRCVIRQPVRSPRLEIALVDARRLDHPTSLPHVLSEDASGLDRGSISEWAPRVPPGFGNVSLSHSVEAMATGSVLFRIRVLGRPDDMSIREVKKIGANGYPITTRRIPNYAWATGVVRVRRP